jgi:hypothetical protein
VTRRKPLVWKALLAFFVACTLASLGAWAYLLTTICSNPRAPVPSLQQVISYNCHGMTVFISPLEDALLRWLIPLEGMFIVLSVVAAAMVLLATAKIRIDVQVHVTGASSGSPPRAGERD